MTESPRYKPLTALTRGMALLLLMAWSSTGGFARDRDASAETDDTAVPGTVSFLTVRNRTDSDEADEYFGGERGPLQAGQCRLRTTPLASMKFIAENIPFYIPDEIVELEAVHELPLAGFWKTMQGGGAGHAPLLYVHGFYISFERGCKRAALFQGNLDLAGRLVLFSWPSDGVIINYTQDEADLYWSVKPLRETLLDMVGRFGAGKLDVVGHSLGARGVFLALVQLAEQGVGHTPLFNQLILIAPDIDTGIFRQYLDAIRPLVKRLTVYVSANDNPLAISRQLHGHPRLGEAGSQLDGLTGVEIIDVSEIPVRYISGHVYHLYHEVVRADLDQLINRNLAAAKRSALKQIRPGYWQLQVDD